MIDPRALRRAFGHFATGVTIVTTRDREGAPVGVTASSFNTVSLSPPLVLWSIGRSAYSFDTFSTASHFAIHVLDADQRALSDRFARASSDKFAGVRLAQGEGGVPLIDGIQTVFECETAQRHDGGDHLILVGRCCRSGCPRMKPIPCCSTAADMPRWIAVTGCWPDPPVRRLVLPCPVRVVICALTG